jgi:hypothetical protein
VDNACGQHPKNVRDDPKNVRIDPKNVRIGVSKSLI